MKYKKSDMVWIRYENSKGDFLYEGPAKIKGELGSSFMSDYKVKIPTSDTLWVIFEKEILYEI